MRSNTRRRLSRQELAGWQRPLDQVEPPAKAVVHSGFVGRVRRFCGGERFEVLPPVPPHAAGLWCTTCETHAGWLSKLQTSKIAFIIRETVAHDYGLMEGTAL